MLRHVHFSCNMENTSVIWYTTVHTYFCIKQLWKFVMYSFGDEFVVVSMLRMKNPSEFESEI